MLLQGFIRQARQHPEAVALIEGERGLSYGELRERSLAVAGALQAREIGAGDRVAIHLDRGIDAVVAAIGVLLAGACYVPLDLKNPPSRRGFILDDAAVAAVIGTGEPPEGLGCWDYRELFQPGGDFVSLSLWERGRGEGLKPQASTDCLGIIGGLNPHPKSLSQAGRDSCGDPAAILYTSGSTGKPKGVVLSHGAIAAFANWAAELVNLGPEDRIASSAPLFFDLSTFDLYAVLARGASLHFVPDALFLAPARLAAWLHEHAITGWYTVPSLLAYLAYKGNLAESPPRTLRFLIFAGEVFPTPALKSLADLLSTTELFNFYGPTETNVCCYWPVDRSRLEASVPIPIGRPAAGNELRINAESGELQVRGPTLLSAYWSEGRLHPVLDKEGWYSTGDRASRNETGEYLFHGRLGRMLKCSGYRVEPAEIEAALIDIPGVAECAVVGLSDPAAGQRPAALLVLKPPRTIGDIQNLLREKLPAYMQPARFRLLDALPRLANGKLDYLGLQALLENSR